jgi:hypothetical protein
MAHDVFISYSGPDKSAAQALCAILENNGVRCWIAPRDIAPGSDWGGSIVNAIGAARMMLLVFSASANASNQIKREVECAANAGVTIVPLRIEDIKPTESFKYFLGNIHWLDALPPPLEKHLQQVSEKLRGILSVQSHSAPVVSPTQPEKQRLPKKLFTRRFFLVRCGIGIVLVGTSVGLFLWNSKKPFVVDPTPPPPLKSPTIDPSQSNPQARSSQSPEFTVPRLFASGDAQLQFLIKNMSKLSTAKIIVAIPRQLNDDSRPPDTNEIRYFHDEDQGAATRVAQKVKDALGVELPVVKREYDGRAGPGYFEIWIARIP